MLQTDTFYHIYNRANGKENLFLNNKNFLFFLKRYAYFIHPIAETYAYCLMPNHFHFLIKIRNYDSFTTIQKFENSDKLNEEEISKYISKQFSNLFSSYTQSFNKVNNRNGSLFQKNFKYKSINHGNYFKNVIHYIHSNPIHHGFCNNTGEWQYSSYESIISSKKTLLSKENVLDIYGGKNSYILFHNQQKTTNLALEMEF